MSKIFDFEKPIIELEKTITDLETSGRTQTPEISSRIESLKQKYREQKAALFSNLSGWETVLVARHPDRPKFENFLPLLSDDFIELHGDRLVGDDRALIGGFAAIDGERVILVGNNKGTTTKDNIERNFGYANPEGFRKVLRLMKLAEKYSLPLVCIIDIPAAYPGKYAEERGVAEAIAHNIYEMARIETPIISVVIGEGGSGGALASGGIGDVILMLNHAIYSIAPPEAASSILFRDAAHAPDAAEALKLRASDLKALGIADEVIDEPLGGAHHDYNATATSLRTAIVRNIRMLSKLSVKKLLARRYEKYTAIGVFDVNSGGMKIH